MADSLLRAMLDASPLPMWICDAQTLRVLAVNDRALDDLGQAQGRITVSLRPDADGAHLRLSIVDTGRGMGEGAGLGLALVHGMVKEHGERIEVKSTRRQDTCFDTVLPVRPQDDAAA